MQPQLHGVALYRFAERTQTEALRLLDQNRQHYIDGAYEEALTMGRLSHQLFANIGDEFNEMLTLGNIGSAEDAVGNSEKAFEVRKRR
jgi:hypothetical protein